MSRTISPRQLAKAVGVSESTMKRWADEGQVRMTKTRGGHRRIPLEEAVQLIRNQALDLADPQALGMPELAARVGGGVDTDIRLYEMLLEGHADRARGLLLALYLQGTSLERLFDETIAPVMHRLGELWQHSDEGISIEHHATDTCINAVNQIRTLLPLPETAAPVAIGATPEGDPYILPSLMAATVFASLGFNAINLGSAMPIELLADAAERNAARIAWLSISHTSKPALLVRQLHDFADRLGTRGACLIVGGRALPSSLNHQHPHLHVVDTMAEMSAFTRGFGITFASGE